MSENTIDVYWSPWSLIDRQYSINMTWGKPKPVLATLPPEIKNNKEGSYRACRASQELFKNSYVINHAFSINARINGEYPTAAIEGVDSSIFSVRSPAFKGCHSIDYDYAWIFFSEESLKITQTPPYLHNTEASKYGYIVSGSFDISKWFRPLTPTYNLWEGVNELSFKKDEPMMYVHFDTDKKIKLKQFRITEDILNIGRSCMGYKNISPFETFDSMYKQFVESGNKDMLLRLIKGELNE